MTTRVVLGIGSNVAEREQKVGEALGWLRCHLTDVKVSACYVTPELSGRYPDYLNCVASGTSYLSPDELNQSIKAYEQSAGRSEQLERQGLVAIDIDIVIENDIVVRPSDYSRTYFAIGYKEISLNIDA